MVQNLIHNGSLPVGSALKNLAGEGAESAETCLGFENVSALLAIWAAQHPGKLPMVRQTLRDVARQEDDK